MRFLLLIVILVAAFLLSEFLGVAMFDAPSNTPTEQTTEETPQKPAQPIATNHAVNESETPTVVRGVMTLSLKQDQIFINGKAVSLSRFQRMAETAARDNILLEFEYDGTVTGSFVDEIKTILRNNETKNAGLE